jgi:hypothetical protein
MESTPKASVQALAKTKEISGRLSGEGVSEIKRTNTYVIGTQEKSPIIEAMEQQEEKMEQEYMNRDRSIHQAFEDKSSSEDDDEFIRRSIINNQKRFSVFNSDYMEKALLQKVIEADEELENKDNITIGTDEKPNGLAKL